MRTIRNDCFKTLCCVSLLIAFAAPLHASDARRDGNWWNKQTTTVKYGYVIGLFDGLELGSLFATWNLPATDNSPAKALESYQSYADKYLAHVTNDQVADGLDIFYRDYRNRQISVYFGVWIVLNNIAGTPQEKIDKMTENFRQSGAQ